VAISVSIIIFSLAVITTIEITYANHTKNHLNNSLVDVTITGDDIPDALLEDLKRGIARDMKIEEQKTFEKTNNSSSNIPQLQTTTTPEAINESPKGKIILTSHIYTETPDDEVFDELPGQVKNIGNGTAEDVSIIFTYYDNSGNAIGNDNTGIYAQILNPGQKSSFLGLREVSKSPDMTYYDISLSWYNSDGTQEYIQDVNVTKDPQKIIPIIEKTEEEGNEIENNPFFNTDGNEIEQLQEEEDEDEEDEEDDNDKKNDKNKEDEEDEDD
jgi:hypothetical protein